MNNNILTSLHNVENYKTEWTNTIYEVVDKQNKLLYEFLYFILEKSKNMGDMEKEKEKEKYILLRGFETVCHVFKIVLYASKNVDLAYYHGQKAYYFYVEFIEQITNDQNVYLNLSSRDAVLFVYKKTIYDIPQVFLRKSEEDATASRSVFLDVNQQLVKNMLLFLKKDGFEKKYIKQTQVIMEKTTALKNVVLLEALSLFTERLLTNSNDIFLFSLDVFLKKWVKLKGVQGQKMVIKKIQSNDWDRNSIEWLFF